MCYIFQGYIDLWRPQRPGVLFGSLREVSELSTCLNNITRVTSLVRRWLWSICLLVVLVASIASLRGEHGVIKGRWHVARGRMRPGVLDRADEKVERTKKRPEVEYQGRNLFSRRFIW
jgi:hypothetical protein